MRQSPQVGTARPSASVAPSGHGFYIGTANMNEVKALVAEDFSCETSPFVLTLFLVPTSLQDGSPFPSTHSIRGRPSRLVAPL
jgi:hypothetical protein